MAEGGTELNTTTDPACSTSKGSSSSSEPRSPGSPFLLTKPPTTTLLNKTCGCFSIYNHRGKYLLHHITAEVLDLDKLTKLGKETKDLVYCFFEPAFNLLYLPMKQIFSDEQTDHLALVLAPHFKQCLPWWRLKFVNAEWELGIVWNWLCKEYICVQDNLTLHLLGLSYHKQDCVYIERISLQDEHDLWQKLGVPLLQAPKKHFMVTDTQYTQFVQPYQAAGKTIHSIPADEKILAGKDVDLFAIKKDVPKYADRHPAKTQKQTRKRSLKARTAVEVHRHHLHEQQVSQLVKYPFCKGLQFRLQLKTVNRSLLQIDYQSSGTSEGSTESHNRSSKSSDPSGSNTPDHEPTVWGKSAGTSGDGELSMFEIEQAKRKQTHDREGFVTDMQNVTQQTDVFSLMWNSTWGVWSSITLLLLKATSCPTKHCSTYLIISDWLRNTASFCNNI